MSSDRILLEAAKNGETSTLSDLIKGGASVHVRNHSKQTALHLAASSGHIEAVQVLLNAKADVNATDDYHWTPLLTAVICGRDTIVQILLNANAAPSAKDLNHQNAFTSCRFRREERNRTHACHREGAHRSP